MIHTIHPLSSIHS